MQVLVVQEVDDLVEERREKRECRSCTTVKLTWHFVNLSGSPRDKKSFSDAEY